MKYYLLAFSLILLFPHCTNKKKHATLPSEIANQKWYATEFVNGSYKIPDNKTYHVLTTTDNKIEVWTTKDIEISFNVIKVDTLLSETGLPAFRVILERLGGNSMGDSYAYEVHLVDKEKDLYRWVYSYNMVDQLDNENFSFHAILDKQLSEKDFFVNKLPQEFEQKNYFPAQYIYPYYYIMADTFLFGASQEWIQYKSKDYSIDYIDSTENGINIILADLNRNKFSIKKIIDNKNNKAYPGVYVGYFEYQDNIRNEYFSDTHFLVESSVMKPMLYEIPSYTYGSSMPHIKRLPPIFTQNALDITRQYADDRLQLTGAKKIYNIDSYIKYKYPNALVVSRDEIRHSDEAPDIAIIISEQYDVYADIDQLEEDGEEEEHTVSQIFKLLFFHPEEGEKEGTYTVHAEIVLDIPKTNTRGEFIVSCIESGFYIKYQVEEVSQKHYWAPSTKPQSLWVYDSNGEASKLSDGISLEDIDELSFSL